MSEKQYIDTPSGGFMEGTSIERLRVTDCSDEEHSPSVHVSAVDEDGSTILDESFKTMADALPLINSCRRAKGLPLVSS